jgi:hypothetical protein
MSKGKHKSTPEPVLPCIVITTDEARRLSALTNSSSFRACHTSSRARWNVQRRSRQIPNRAA